MFDPHDLGRTLCRYASDESIFRGMTPQFRGAAHGNSISSGYAAQDVSTPALNRELNNE